MDWRRVPCPGLLQAGLWKQVLWGGSYAVRGTGAICGRCFEGFVANSIEEEVGPDFRVVASGSGRRESKFSVMNIYAGR